VNPLLKFIVRRLEGKLQDARYFSDQVDHHEAFDAIMEDMEVYFDELKQIVGEVI
jgi:hypothetical protein